jgi:hypothetical protein
MTSCHGGSIGLISLFCPSRGRPKAAQELLDSFLATKGLNSTELIFLVDADDDSGKTYPGNVRWGDPTGDPTGPLNRAAVTATADIVGFIGDDSRLETVGWDLQVTRALDTPGFCWGFDGTSPSAWPSTIFVSKRIVNSLGWLALPTLKRGFFDVCWVKLAQDSGMARVIPAMFRHDNSAGDPASPNFKPEAQVPPAVIAEDEAAYKAWLKDAASDVRKVRLADLARFF